jgi:hypothetical protein
MNLIENITMEKADGRQAEAVESLRKLIEDGTSYKVDSILFNGREHRLVAVQANTVRDEAQDFGCELQDLIESNGWRVIKWNGNAEELASEEEVSAERREPGRNGKMTNATENG